MSELPVDKKPKPSVYVGPDGKERTFIQAREKKLDLQRDVGKMRVLVNDVD